MRAYGCAFNVKDIFRYFNIKSLKTKQKDIGKKLRDLASEIFIKQYKMVLEDCINNGDTFILPLTGEPKANICVKRISGERFKKCRQNGMFQDIDFLSSNFSANRLTFTMCRNSINKEKPIYINGELKQKLTDNTNNGKQYC